VLEDAGELYSREFIRASDLARRRQRPLEGVDDPKTRASGFARVGENSARRWGRGLARVSSREGAKDDEKAWVLTRTRLRARERWGSQLRDEDAASREWAVGFLKVESWDLAGEAS